MAIPVIAVNQNPTIPPLNLIIGGQRILSGVVECVFRGQSNVDITRDSLTFTIQRVDLGTGRVPPVAGCIASPASFGHDGSSIAPLWAVDSAQAVGYHNEDRGTAQADLEVVINLAVRGIDAFIVRVNYAVFYFPA